MHTDIKSYNQSQSTADAAICDLLEKLICETLPEAENKIFG